MEVSSVANQAVWLKEQMTSTQLGTVALKQAADAQQQVADMLAKNAEKVVGSSQSEPGRFSTYA